jgi:HigB_toxin, RelE-like toxic component of a toxin-antitoxin system
MPILGKFLVFDFRNNRYRLITIIQYLKTIAGKPTAPVLANPARMIAKGAPHIIRNDEELAS